MTSISGSTKTVRVAPLLPIVHRAMPGICIRDGVPMTGGGIPSQPHLELTYADPIAKVQFFPEIYYDAWSQIALDPSGVVVASNIAKSVDSPGVRDHAARIRGTIAALDVVTVPEGPPLAILATPRHANYYHFLFDDLARLGFYEEVPDWQQMRFPVPRPQPWQQECYGAAGIGDRLTLLGKRIYRLRNVWIAPRGLTSIHTVRTRGYARVQRLRREFGAVLPTKPWRRLFISRDGTRHRRLLNESTVQAFVTKAGFEIIHPERLPVSEQIQMFTEAGIVLGVFGAGLTNAIFMAPGASLLEIAPPTSVVPTAHNAIFSTLCGLRNLRYGIVLGDAATFVPETHDFAAPLPWLERLVSHFSA